MHETPNPQSMSVDWGFYMVYWFSGSVAKLNL